MWSSLAFKRQHGDLEEGRLHGNVWQHMWKRRLLPTEVDIQKTNTNTQVPIICRHLTKHKSPVKKTTNHNSSQEIGLRAAAPHENDIRPYRMCNCACCIMLTPRICLDKTNPDRCPNWALRLCWKLLVVFMTFNVSHTSTDERRVLHSSKCLSGCRPYTC